MQSFLVGITVILSIAYLGKRMYNTFSKKDGCNGCAGGCSNINFDTVKPKKNNF